MWVPVERLPIYNFVFCNVLHKNICMKDVKVFFNIIISHFYAQDGEKSKRKKREMRQRKNGKKEERELKQRCLSIFAGLNIINYDRFAISGEGQTKCVLDLRQPVYSPEPFGFA